MGIVYKNDSNGKPFIALDKNYQKQVLEYYDDYHKDLNDITKRIIEKYSACLIIDLHSFSDEYVYKLFNKTNCPDICIGINYDYDSFILKLTVNHFKKRGYSVDINYPYSRTIIPSNYLYKSNTGIISIMIEINKCIYLNDKYNELDLLKTKKLKHCLYSLYRKYKLYSLYMSIKNKFKGGNKHVDISERH